MYLAQEVGAVMQKEKISARIKELLDLGLRKYEVMQLLDHECRLYGYDFYMYIYTEHIKPKLDEVL